MIAKILPLALLICTAANAERTSAAGRLYVAPSGNDAWSGQSATPNSDRSDGPLVTLERARDAIRAMKQKSGLPAGGVIVELAAGAYELARPLALTAQDSGTAEAPIVYRAATGAEVRLTGGRRVADWRETTDPAVLARLDEKARGQVFQADLKALGIADFGRVAGGGLALYFADQPARIARWPNEGFAKIREITAEAPTEMHGRKGSKVGVFYYEGDRPKRWVQEGDLWLHGYWFWDWKDDYQQVAAIDPEQQQIRLAKPDHNYGYLRGARYCALNALAELDEAGEWQLNRRTGILYFWPPAPLASARCVVSVQPSLVLADHASHVSFEGLTVECARGVAIRVVEGTGMQIVGCTVRNTGGQGVEIAGGAEHAVVDCEIYNLDGGGVVLAGGDRATLTPGKHRAENNHIHDYARWKRTYSPAIAVSGVGNRVRHNLIHDAPHNGIYLWGNDHVVELNEVHHVCLETDDVGAFYMGRDWTQRGNLVRYNYFHHLGKYGGGIGVMGVYLDDWSSGTTVFGNICYKAGYGVLIGGGRDNTVENNVLVDCTPSVHIDSRGLSWAKSYFDGTNNILVTRLGAVDYRSPPWSTRYPQLVTLYEDEPALAKGNVIARNISVGGRWIDLRDGLTESVVKLQDNLVDVDPKFVDRDHQDFRLEKDSPAYALGFRAIPVEKIGLQRRDEPKDAGAIRLP